MQKKPSDLTEHLERLFGSARAAVQNKGNIQSWKKTSGGKIFVTSEKSRELL